MDDPRNSSPPDKRDVEEFAANWWGSMSACGKDGKAFKIVDVVDPENFVDFAYDVLYRFSSIRNPWDE